MRRYRLTVILLAVEAEIYLSTYNKNLPHQLFCTRLSCTKVDTSYFLPMNEEIYILSIKTTPRSALFISSDH